MLLPMGSEEKPRQLPYRWDISDVVNWGALVGLPCWLLPVAQVGEEHAQLDAGGCSQSGSLVSERLGRAAERSATCEDDVAE
jgi:hypothetical protein